MPTLEKLARRRARATTRFHTTALCSPTRDGAASPDATIIRTTPARSWRSPPRSPATPGCAPRASRRWRRSCARTATAPPRSASTTRPPPWEVSVSGPFDRWPTHSGFDKFYGFIGGETNQWSPLIYDGTTKVEAPDDPNYHFTDRHDEPGDRLDRATSTSLTPDKPFFTYFATGATHAPHHVPKDWIGRSSRASSTAAGTSTARRRSRGRTQLGIVPAGRQARAQACRRSRTGTR